MTDALILIDVDGVLNPWQRQGPQWEKHRAVADGTTWNVILNPDHGPMLLTLAAETGAELVWATTWDHDANAEIGPRIGLPELPVIVVADHPGAPGVHPKTPPVAEYVERRPFVWFDDDLTAVDSRYLKAHEGVGEHLIVHVGPKKGLTSKHVEMAAAWLANRSTSKES
jgi:hypothetical protein